MSARIAAPQNTNPAITTRSHWRTKIMRSKRVHQVLLLLMLVLSLTAWAGAQSTQDAAMPSVKTDSNAVEQTEKNEMRDELKALRAEVERLRAEVAQKSTTPAEAPASDYSGAAPAPMEPG